MRTGFVSVLNSKKYRNTHATRIAACVCMLFTVLPFSFLHAQSVTITAKADTVNMLIGDHIHLTLQAEYPPGYHLQFPIAPDTIGKLEVISRSKMDTIAAPDSVHTILKQSLTITCYDSGYYVITPFIVSYKQDGDTATHTAETEPILVTVQTLQVDTSQAIKEIKGPLDVPFSIREYLPYIGGILFLVAAIYFLYRYLKKRKRLPGEPVLVRTPKRPAHEIALEELEKLHREKVWQRGEFKAYHSRISDITRTYIEQRFGFGAMEQTTDEILGHFRSHSISAESKQKLSQLLTLSDLVKFAKVHPLPDENDLSWKQSFEFVRETMMQQEGEKQATPDGEEESENQRNIESKKLSENE